MLRLRKEGEIRSVIKAVFQMETLDEPLASYATSAVAVEAIPRQPVGPA